MPGKRLPAFVRLAATTGVKALVESYVRKGHDVNATDTKQRTLLLMAAARGHADICRLLIDAGADPALRDANGDDALSVAIKYQRAETEAVLRASVSRPVVAPSGTSSPVGIDSLSRGTVPTGAATSGSRDEDQHSDQWRELIESQPPPESPTVREDAARLQNRISEHVATDKDTDWSDIEVELPQAATPRDPNWTEWLDGVRCLIDFGLSWGWVTAFQVAEVAASAEVRAGQDEIDARLRIMLGDMGIPVEEDPLPESIAHQCSGHEPQSRNGHDGVVDEAISFLDQLSLERDSRTYYWKDAARRKLLSKDEEVALAIRIENASTEILDVVSRCPDAMQIAIEWAEQLAHETGESDDGTTREYEARSESDVDSSSRVVQFFGSDATAVLNGLNTIRRLLESASQGDPGDAIRDALISLRPSDAAVSALVDPVMNDTTRPDAVRTLTSAMREREKAYWTFAEANLRLVTWCATKYGGIPFMDRVQEGNIGLLKAIERFDPHQGAKFSTYATWWIRQGISRAVADTGRMIRLPVHMVELTRKMRTAVDTAVERSGRRPGTQELARQLDVPVRSVEAALAVPPDAEPSGLLHEDCSSLPVTTAAGADFAERLALRRDLERALDTLASREARVVRMRFGLTDGVDRTLQETGDAFGLTRERIRQIEAKALKKLGRVLHGTRLDWRKCG